MTMSLWVVIAAALIAVIGTIYTARMSLRTNQNTLKQSLEIKMREIAEDNAQEAEEARQSERGSNLAEAKQIREELKLSREEMRCDRDRVAVQLKAEQCRASEAEQLAQAERTELRVEISVLQAKQWEIDTERAQHKLLVETLKKQHGAEIAKYKRQLSALAATVTRMETRIKEIEAGKVLTPA